MKKFLTFIILFQFTGLFIYADEQREVKLNDDNPQKTIELANCNIFVSKGETDDDENTKVAIEIENKDESNVVILFGHAFSEKDLKKQSPSIRFDKKYPKTNRSLETFNGGKNVLFIEPTDKRRLLEGIQIKKDKKYTCHLPFYIAKYKSNKRNKMLIMEQEILELEIGVEIKPDLDYIRLESECKVLIDEIGKKSFCPNPKHKQSLEEKKKYKESIDSLVSVIVAFRDKYYSQDKGYKRYDELKQKLDGIQFAEIDCGKHSIPVSVSKDKCKYCNLSPQQIYHKLDDIYKKIYISNNRKATKNSVMPDVNLLYNCSRHSGAWKKSEYKSKITDRYNKICNF